MRVLLVGLAALTMVACGDGTGTSTSSGAGGATGTTTTSSSSSTATSVASTSVTTSSASSTASTSSTSSTSSTASSSSGTGGAMTSAGGTIVPLYTDPSDASWAVVANGKTTHPTVGVRAIINPNSGPGATKDPAYVSGTATLAQAGVVVLGYVATTYANKTQAAAEAEIDRYVSWYPAVHGIFFDEMSNTAGDEGYYTALSKYVKSKGLSVTVGNPGQDTLSSFIGTVDTMLIYESGGLPSIASLGGWHDQVAKSYFGVIPYAVPSLDATFVQQARQHVGFVYVTNDDLPNPWDSLPPYFSALLDALE